VERFNELDRLRRVLAVQREIMGLANLDVVMHTIAKRSQELTGATAAAVELLNGDSMVFRPTTANSEMVGVRLHVDSSLSGHAIRTGQILVCGDTETDPRVDREACRSLGIRSIIAVPLANEGHTIGVLKVTSEAPHAFVADHVATLTEMVSFLSIAMARATAERERTEFDQRFRMLAEHASDAIISMDVQGKIVFWNQSASRIFGFSLDEMIGCSLTRIIPERYAAAHTAAVARGGSANGSIIIGRTVEVEARCRDGREIPIELSVSSWHAAGRRYYTGILRDASARRAALDAARTDHLTGALTRGAGEEAIARVAAHTRAISFVLFDLDRFKEVNDEHGHGAGDEVLRETGQRIRAVLRASDIVVRWGGEEILVALPDTTIAGARCLAERVRFAVSQSAMSFGGTITTSAGVAERGDNESTHDTISRADTALYEAKRTGRDRVCG
jgi:diguanylate cyclase (GGDEF)-like protein/PAS domain S-box-containing protein